MLKEFRTFAVRGNAVDMAVGIIIGTAFGKIVSSLVNDVVMPPIGMLAGGVDFTRLSVALGEGEDAARINYGNFLQVTLDFLIVAFAIFLLVKAVNKLKRKEVQKPAEPAKPSDEVRLLTEIRDALEARG